MSEIPLPNQSSHLLFITAVVDKVPTGHVARWVSVLTYSWPVASQVHLGTATEHYILDDEGAVCGIKFKDQEPMDIDMVIVSCGIKPRDELARDCGLEVRDT